MNRRKLLKLRKEVDQFRAGIANVRERELVSLALSTGRVTVIRGTEPTYGRPGWPPLTIPQPGHMAKYTAKNILKQIDRDLDALEEELGDEDAGEEGDDEKRGDPS